MKVIILSLCVLVIRSCSFTTQQTAIIFTNIILELKPAFSKVKRTIFNHEKKMILVSPKVKSTIFQDNKSKTLLLPEIKFLILQTDKIQI